MVGSTGLHLKTRCEISQNNAKAHGLDAYLWSMNFVTGGTGLVGIHLIAALLARGEAVRALFRSPASRGYAEKKLTEKGVSLDQLEWLEGDVLDIQAIEDAMRGCTRVFHAAALVSFHRCDRDALYRVNIGGTANIVNAALGEGIETLVYISSVAALGRNTKGIPISESSEWKDGPQLSNYARSKHMAEREVWRGREEGLRVVIVQPSIILGAGDFGRSSSEIFRRVYEGLPFYPPGSNGFVGVQDVVAATLHLLDHGHFNRSFLLVSENRSWQSIMTAIAKQLNRKAPQRTATRFLMHLARIGVWLQQLVTGRKAFITRESVRSAQGTMVYDQRRVIDETGFVFTPIDEVIAGTAQYFLQQEAQVEQDRRKE